MNAAIKERWIDALISGEYEQTEDVLKDDVGFCCLGVLCDIVKDEVGGRWEEQEDGIVKFILPFETAFSVLPEAVVGYAELDGDNPSVNFDGANLTLAELNDERMSFGQIAAIIEEKL
jgi:hypothetical protein